MLNLVHQREEQLCLLVPDHIDVPLQIRIARILEISTISDIDKETEKLLDLGESITQIKNLIEEKFEELSTIFEHFSPPKEVQSAWEELNFWLDVWEGDCPTFWQQFDLKTKNVDSNLIMLVNDRLNFEFFLSKLSSHLSIIDKWLDTVVSTIQQNLLL